MSGFWIKRLRATGKALASAEVEFSNSLNVISGASDTGKSYILQCINYMLGAKEPPKSVPEDAGYDTLFLEIIGEDNASHTLQRSLKGGGDFFYYPSALTDISPDAGVHLRWKHDPKRTDTVSAFLLKLCELTGTIIKRKIGATRPLSFRDICRFVIVDETSIIAERSPIYPSAQFTKQTEDKSVFDFLVSGEDNSSIITAPDITVRKAGWRAKAELLDDLIRHLESRANGTTEDLEAQLSKIDTSIEEITTVVASNSSLVHEVQQSKRKSWQDLQSANSRRLIVEQLLARFEVLARHYRSDIERLDFLTEGDHYLSQLGSEIHCAVCGNLIEDHSAVEVVKERLLGTTMREASRAEKSKLVIQLADLEKTVEDLTAEQTQLVETSKSLQTAIAASENQLRVELTPQASTSREELDQLMTAKRAVVDALNVSQQLEELARQRQALGKEPKQSKAANKTDNTVSEVGGRRLFCNEVERILKSWKYAQQGVVEFDEAMDMVVAGVPRRSHGKGIRAILQSAFTYGLLVNTSDRHPGFIVLDSPLTSYREKDAYEVDEDVQEGFFRTLSQQVEGQVIILENKEPPESLKKSMRYLHFTGQKNVGRAGFYPIKAKKG